MCAFDIQYEYECVLTFVLVCCQILLMFIINFCSFDVLLFINDTIVSKVEDKLRKKNYLLNGFAIFGRNFK